MTNQTNQPSLLKQCEQNVLNHAKWWTDFDKILWDLHYSISSKVNPSSKEDLHLAFKLLHRVASSEMNQALADCFAFVGVGGEEAEQYSRQKAAEVFKTHRVMKFLDENLNMPSYWNAPEEQQLQEEISKKLGG